MINCIGMGSKSNGKVQKKNHFGGLDNYREPFIHALEVNRP